MARRPRSAPLAWRGLGQIAAAVAFVLTLPYGPGLGGLATARTARAEHLVIDARLHYVNAKGSYLIEEGSATGPLGGLVKARIRVTADISGTFTFYPRGGSISGRGIGKLHESGTYASFGGSVTVLGGSGRYAHARGKGGFYGVYNRQTLGVTIQTTGSLSY
jgi:hypothetical protein